MHHLTRRITTAFIVSILSLFTAISSALADEDPNKNWDSDDNDMPMFISDSNTGYVDNAIIQNQFRIRVDSGSNSHFPDMAELFYGACGCHRVLGLNPSAPGPAGTLDPSSPMTSPLIETSVDYQELSFDFEYALENNLSLFAELPLRFIDGELLGKEQGLGDIRIGAKFGLLGNSSPHLTAQLRAYLPTGEAKKGLGTDHYSLEPAILFFSRLNEQWTFSSELRYWIPIDGTSGQGTPSKVDYSGDILRFGVGLGYDFNLDSRTRISPIAELVTWKILGGQALMSMDGTPMNAQWIEVKGKVITNFKLGVRANFANKHSIFVGYGEPLSDWELYENIIRLEFRTSY